jgi:ergothioneine biosynthesis protein EgtB
MNLSALTAAGSQPLLAERFGATRAESIRLIAGLSEEDCAIQSMPDASPLKWHLAHTTWFFEVFLLERYQRDFEPFDPAFRILFNSYYNSVGDKHPRPQRGLLSRPGLRHVLTYRSQVEQRMSALFDSLIGDTEFCRLVELGIAHEQQHQELMLTDLKHLLSCNPLLPAYRDGWPLTTASVVPMNWLSFDARLATIGTDAKTFAFDNERPEHRVWVDPFELATRPVTNGEVLDFIEDDGYRRPELWLSLGWDCVRNQGWQAPMYWRQIDQQWHVFTLRGFAPIARDAPAAHLSYFEADALARWFDARLPTEAEWELAAQLGSATIEGNFANTGVFHPLVPARVHRSDELAQMWGDVWEWTQSSYSAYPGFKPDAGAIGEYNGKFMCNQYVLRGGSCATPRDQMRLSYRNFFPADARWQFSGLRLARSA